MTCKTGRRLVFDAEIDAFADLWALWINYRDGIPVETEKMEDLNHNIIMSWLLYVSCIQ